MLDPKFNVTPTIKLLSDVAVRAVKEPDQRDAVSTPPRTGKSELLAVWTPVWALGENHDYKIVVVSHGDDLAQTHSRKIRAIVREHHEYLGFRIAADKQAVGRWNVEGASGGVLAAGISSGITGHGADLMIVDDVVKDAAEADSAAHRKRILNEYRSTLATRIHPGGSCMVVMTRWHEQDLVGALLKQEPEVWHQTNIPAVSESGVPDALNRPPGQTMLSALGYTPDHYRAMRRTSGERAWYAMYMGVPSTPEGGLVKREWLESHRLAVAPANPVLTVVAVDPSDSGTGDSCGLVATSLMGGNRVAMIADRSKPMTSDQWAREAVRLALDVGASEIAVEGFSARETYTRVVKEAIERAAVEHLARTGEEMRPIRVSTWPPKGRPRVGDAQARSAALLQALEVGTCQLAGHFPDFEKRAIEWQSGQHQPDSLAALVIGHDVCVHAAGVEWDMAGPMPSASAQVAQSVYNAAHGITRGAPVTDMSAWRRRVG